ncbi:MAG: amino acid ABC transporter ATP-binding protein [Parvibaculaceae bacterium]
MTASIVEVRHLNKSYGRIHVLKDISLKVEEREIVMLLGPSGGGKSTFLRCLNRIEAWNSGEVEVCGVDMGGTLAKGRHRRDSDREISRKRRSIGMVFQRFNLFPHLTALDNVAVGPHRVLGTTLDQARRDAAVLLERVHLAGHKDKRPAQLSGGQQQRVGIARALAMKPRLLLLDEPTSALDPELVGEVLEVIREVAREGMTMMIVTHEVAFAREVGSRILFMEDGRIVRDAPPKAFFGSVTDVRIGNFMRRVAGAE